jgi:phosphoribosyl 1,2-cyclic phosphodiesterase
VQGWHWRAPAPKAGVLRGVQIDTNHFKSHVHKELFVDPLRPGSFTLWGTRDSRGNVEANHSMEIMRANSESGRIDHARFNRTAHTHMSIERLIELLKANDLSKAQQIWLLHLSSENSSEDDFKDKVQRATGVPTFVAGR